MKFISHRGNIFDKKPELENSIHYINSALNMGYDVEIDLWYDNGFWLGHDSPQYQVDVHFLSNKKLWCHAKNLEALDKLLLLKTRCFWHETDSYTITSDGIVWAYPGSKLSKNCVCVLPETNNISITKCYGICSDFIDKYKNEYCYTI